LRPARSFAHAGQRRHALLKLLRRAPDEPFAPSLERLARHIGEPLGIARASSGRWKMAAGEADLVEAVKADIGDGTPFGTLEARLSKSEWGLPSEMTALIVAAQLRAGELTAFDAQGREVSPSQIGLPLRRGVHLLRAGRLPETQTWTALAVLARELELNRVGAPTFVEAARMAGELTNWRDELGRSLDLARARSAQLKRALRHDRASWPGFEARVKRWRALERLEFARRRTFIARRFARCSEIGRAKRDSTPSMRFWKRDCRRFWRRTRCWSRPIWWRRRTLDERRRFWNVSARAKRFARRRFNRIRRALEPILRAKLRAWHRAQHDPARVLALRRLAQSDALRALERLGALQIAIRGGRHFARFN
jgi:hypothetical protein